MPSVGVYFSPQSYYLHWNQEGDANLPQNALLGYTRALFRSHIPYTIVEEEHLESLDEIDVLFMPRSLVIDAEQADALGDWLESGGTLVAEAECGAFGRNGLYRYAEDRFLADLTGIADVGRRTLVGNAVNVSVASQDLQLPAKQWLTPFGAGAGQVLSETADGPLFVRVPVGEGQVILCGAIMGDAYFEAPPALTRPMHLRRDFESFVAALVQQAGVELPAEVVSPEGLAARDVHVRTGYTLGAHGLCVL